MTHNFKPIIIIVSSESSYDTAIDVMSIDFTKENCL